MSSIKLSENQKTKILAFLRKQSGIYVKNGEKTILFLEAVLWIVRSGSQWELLPPAYGKWNSVYKRFVRWCKRDKFETMHAHFAGDSDLEYLLIDSTIIRAHPCAAGAATPKPEQANPVQAQAEKPAPDAQSEGSLKQALESKADKPQAEDAAAPVAQTESFLNQALGRSRGGFSTKIHVVVDALGNPLDFVLTGGQVHDVTQASKLLEGLKADYVLADRGYDSDRFLERIKQMGAIPVIPARKNRTQPRDYDKHIYKERHLVECFINKIKWYRRIFSRFDKLAKHFLGFLSFVSALIWLR
jgi:transposase